MRGEEYVREGGKGREGGENWGHVEGWLRVEGRGGGGERERPIQWKGKINTQSTKP